MKIRVNASAAKETINHSAMSAGSVSDALGKDKGIVLTFGDDTELNVIHQPIPADLMRQQPARDVTIFTASNVAVEGLEGTRTINVSRILSMVCPSSNTLADCADYLNEHMVRGTITVDVETLTQFNNARRWANAVIA